MALAVLYDATCYWSEALTLIKLLSSLAIFTKSAVLSYLAALTKVEAFLTLWLTFLAAY
jgi:hypothetical protein